ncbi:RAB6-interacting golgin [Varanus komodoensis]|nr:RAB6-interacting golgin [Varanus komodoensis]
MCPGIVGHPGAFGVRKRPPGPEDKEAASALISAGVQRSALACTHEKCLLDLCPSVRTSLTKTTPPNTQVMGRKYPSESPLEQQQRSKPPRSWPRSHHQHLQRKRPVQEPSEKMEVPVGAALAPQIPRSISESPPQRSPPQSSSAGEQENPRNQQVEPALEKSCNGDPSTEPNHHLVTKKMELLVNAGDGALNCSEGFFGEEGEERQLLVNFDVLPIVRQEKSRWEILQQEQKLMEEKNKRKKALLAKAIAERSKRTQAETVKLSRIQKQLQALDEMVSADIGILRNKIEQASWDYSCARKRYDKAEAEYVAAKLDLQKKTGIKEQLTEHLCTIIQQNELRKARRLEELMRQLEVAAEAENLELEVEAEQMLQQQEAEARRQAAESQRPAAVGMQDTAPQAAGKGQENKDHGGSEAPVEQPTPSQASGHGRTANSEEVTAHNTST